jgi:lipoprotein-anchoring transpeptidase ErfK/SrfK
LHFFLASAIWKSEAGRDAMTALKQNRLRVAAMMTVVLATQLTAQSAAGQAAVNLPAEKEQVQAAVAQRVIVVSLEDRKLALLENGEVKKVYSVAVGKPSTPSPVGTFTIERRVMNPTYSHNGRTVGPGPGNPVGTRWMGLSKSGYGIHGTNEPKSIGKAASHGCIRMGKADLEEFYGMVRVGDTVELIGQRNEETAILFGGAVPAVAPTQPVVMAQSEPASVTPETVKADAPASVVAGAALR